MVPDEGNILAGLTTDLDRSFERLMTAYWHQLYAFVLRRTANAQDAEDIVSEVFVRSYIALKGYPVERIRLLKLRSWLFKIAYHEYCRHIGKSTSPAVSLSGYLDERTLFEQEEEESQQPDMLFESAERRQELEKLVATLPERYREAVSLYYLEEFNYQEVADLLDQPIGTIKSSVHRGIRLLRKMVSTQSNEVY